MTFADGANTLTTGLGTYTLGVRQLQTELVRYRHAFQLILKSVNWPLGRILPKGPTDYTNAVGQLASGQDIIKRSDRLCRVVINWLTAQGNYQLPIRCGKSCRWRKSIKQSIAKLITGVNQLSASNEEIQNYQAVHHLATGLEHAMTTVQQSGMTAEQVQLQDLAGLTAVQNRSFN